MPEPKRTTVLIIDETTGRETVIEIENAPINDRPTAPPPPGAVDPNDLDLEQQLHYFAEVLIAGYAVRHGRLPAGQEEIRDKDGTVRLRLVHDPARSKSIKDTAAAVTVRALGRHYVEWFGRIEPEFAEVVYMADGGGVFHFLRRPGAWTSAN